MQLTSGDGSVAPSARRPNQSVRLKPRVARAPACRKSRRLQAVAELDWPVGIQTEHSYALPGVPDFITRRVGKTRFTTFAVPLYSFSNSIFTVKHKGSMGYMGPIDLRRRSVFALLLLLSAGSSVRPCLAQAVAVAEVAGVVSDSSGAAIPGAAVKITETDRQTSRTAVTDPDGRYVLPNLPVGPYQLEVNANGFKSYNQSGIVLQVGNHVQVNVVMQVGAMTEHVEVNAAASMVETRENTVAQVIDQQRIMELPLNGRQPTQLILLSGAALTAPGGGMVGSKNYFSSTTISVAGGQANGVNYMLDGGDHNDSMTNVNMPIPFPDALQEFSVQTSSLPARFGLHPGAVVNALTKSGTNNWHGDLFEFLRNGDMNARNTFATVHDSLKRNQFGGTVGGKIIRDKLFVFGGFQGTRQRSDPPQTISFVATPAVLNGDFSAIESAGCVSSGARTLRDPSNGQPFAGNQIPVSRFNQQAVNLITKYVPISNDPCGSITYGIPATGDEEQFITRVDWVQNSKHTLYGRYFLAQYKNPPVFDGKNALTTTAPGNWERAQTVTLGDTLRLQRGHSELVPRHLQPPARQSRRRPRTISPPRISASTCSPPCRTFCRWAFRTTGALDAAPAPPGTSIPTHGTSPTTWT